MIAIHVSEKVFAFKACHLLTRNDISCFVKAQNLNQLIRLLVLTHGYQRCPIAEADYLVCSALCESILQGFCSFLEFLVFGVFIPKL